MKITVGKLKQLIREVAKRGESLSSQREQLMAPQLHDVCHALDVKGFRNQVSGDGQYHHPFGKGSEHYDLYFDDEAGERIPSYIATPYSPGRGKPDEIRVTIALANDAKTYADPEHVKLFQRAATTLQDAGFTLKPYGTTRDEMLNQGSRLIVLLDPQSEAPAGYVDAEKIAKQVMRSVSDIDDITTQLQARNGSVTLRDDVTGATYSAYKNGYVRKQLPGAVDKQIMARPGDGGEAWLAARVIKAVQAARQRKNEDHGR